ncbi:hypothetical protein RFI_30699 [Reticulomyxa filosa]|uniref:Uncharacterized protein n=1 Tax=Reticulomyxa filosa TaxID=46433 RepID=X6LXL6_RETFI|nr:hypothetical protein RFI_30699 [Reticulomyxa filosa]|eukprot:ETO06693.1 hypothetical protein RFI_30699 [Reticulomyxa filosa]
MYIIYNPFQQICLLLTFGKFLINMHACMYVYTCMCKIYHCYSDHHSTIFTALHNLKKQSSSGKVLQATENFRKIRGYAGDTMHLARMFGGVGEDNNLEFLYDIWVPQTPDGKHVALHHTMEDKSDDNNNDGKSKNDEHIIKPKRKTHDSIQKDLKENPQNFYEHCGMEAQRTYKVYKELRKQLINTTCEPMLVATDLKKKLEELIGSAKPNLTLWDVYLCTWLPFGQLLASMETVGFPCQTQILKEMEAIAKQERQEQHDIFRQWIRPWFDNRTEIMNLKRFSLSLSLFFF